MEPTPLPTVKEDEALDMPPMDTVEMALEVAPASPVPHLKLSAVRFALAVIIGLATVIAIMYWFLGNGVTLRYHIVDPIGSSQRADAKVEKYQIVSGYFTAAIGMLMETFFHIFMAVMIVYLGNLKWYPGDRPKNGRTPFKQHALFFFTPMIMYALNIGFSSLNIQHSTVGLERIFVKDDLVAAAQNARVNFTNNTALQAEYNCVENTILRAAVRRQVVPFTIKADSPCKLPVDAQGADQPVLPSVRDIRSTAAVYGFPVQTWNFAAMPYALEPTQKFDFSVSTYDQKSKQSVDQEFQQFMQTTGFSLFRGYEMFLQGKTLLERSISDSNVTATYPCTWVDGRSQGDLTADQLSALESELSESASSTSSGSSGRRRQLLDDESEEETSFGYFASGEYAGMRVCYGAITSLPSIGNAMNNESKQTLEAFVDTVGSSLNRTLPPLDLNEMNISFETYELSQQINYTSITIDMPLSMDTKYRNMSDYCKADGTLTDSQAAGMDSNSIAMAEQTLCNQTWYFFDQPNSMCGSSNCIFWDHSQTARIKKQVMLMPYTTNCSVGNLKYDTDLLNFLPSGCIEQNNSVLLFGLSSYIGGDTLYTSYAKDSPPLLTDARRHIVISIGRLEWALDDVSGAFNATCHVGNGDGCTGLVHRLQNLTSPASPTSQALVLGANQLPDLRNRTFRSPVPLVTLNSRPLYYAKYNQYFEWEYVSRDNILTDNWPPSQNRQGSECSMLVDSYLQQIETNHLFLDHSQQTMYTSALYYLFQDAAVKTVASPTRTPYDSTSWLYVGSTSLKGDREKKQIKFSIPLASAIATWIGMALIMALTLLVIFVPQERLKHSTKPNFAAQYLEFLTNDVYEAELHRRKLAHDTCVDPVDVDDYTVDTITFHYKDDPTKSICLYEYESKEDRSLEGEQPADPSIASI